VENWINNMSKNLPLLLQAPVKGMLPRTVTTVCAEKVSRQAEYYQQVCSPGLTACSAPQPK